MSQTTLKLEMKFVTAEGKNKNINLNNPKPALERGIVEKAMADIVAQNMFEQEGVQLYDKVRGARYVTRTVEDIFESEAQ